MEWYCSEPRLSFRRTVVLRDRIHLESRHLTPGTINLRLGGNWLTAERSQRLWQAPDGARLKEKRDRALLAVSLACGARRHEAVNLDFCHIQQREEHWAIVDLKGKTGHTRTIPMPAWVKNVLDQWLQPVNITSGKLFRRVHKIGKAWGNGLTAKAVWHLVRESGNMPRKPGSTS